MNLDLNSNISIYLQIANIIENAIFENIYKEEEKIPSTNDFSKLLNINPHTVLKGMNILVDQNLIYKKRGLGMFVCKGACDIVVNKKRKEFYDSKIQELILESKKLKITKEALIFEIEKLYETKNN